MADRERIGQVLNNLFANAARHSPASSPIRIGATPDGVHVAISVSDEGRGVAPERLPHLFRKHADAVGGDREHGVEYSLGLAICRGLVGFARGDGGGGGIRTHGGLSSTPVFKTGAFDHSATPPNEPATIARRSDDLRGYPAVISSTPPTYGQSAAGMRTDPEAVW